MSQTETLALPVIDFAQLTGDEQQRKQTIEKLGQAARDVGFFYLINHGVEKTVLDNVQNVARSFFAFTRRKAES